MTRDGALRMIHYPKIPVAPTRSSSVGLEHLPWEQGVGGSSPSCATIISIKEESVEEDSPYVLNPEKRIITTRVYYEDSVVETLYWDTLPTDGVLLIVLLRADGSRRTLQQKDWYYQAPGMNDSIYGATDDREEIKRYYRATVLRGKTTDDVTYEAVRLHAQQ